MSRRRDMDDMDPGRSRRSTARAVGVFVLLWAVASWATPGISGQAPRWELDLNASRIRYDSAAALNAPSVSSLLEWRRPSLFARVSGSITGFEGSGWSTQARGDLAGWLSPFGVASPFRLELAGVASASRHSSDFNARMGRSDVRLHMAGRRVGGWLGAGAAIARNAFDTASLTGFLPSVGIWAQNGSVRATASYVHARVSGRTFPEGSLVVALSDGPLDVSIYGGFRQSPFEGADLDERWAGASAAIWVGTNAAIVVSGGGYSSDVLQGLPGGDFLSIGVRLTARRERLIPRRVEAPIVYTAEAARTRGITLSVPDADRVEIAGDFNGWQPERLERDTSGRWIVPTRLEPGVYRFNLRVDGDRWIVPEGVPEVEDGFGDRVGLLIISGDG